MINDLSKLLLGGEQEYSLDAAYIRAEENATANAAKTIEWLLSIDVSTVRYE